MRGKYFIRFLLWASLIVSSSVACSASDSLDIWRLRNPNALNTVRFVGGIFVGVGDQGKVATSPDGTNWTFQTLATTASFRGVAYTTSTFVIVGDAGSIWVSSDANAWTRVISSTLTNSLTDVAWNPQMHVLVASANDFYGNQITYSSNLFKWRNVALPAPPYSSNTQMKRVTCVGGTFFAAGGGSFDDHIWKSTNGVNWEYVRYANQYAGNFVFGNGKLAFVGNEGCPLVSTDLGISWGQITDTNVCSKGCFLCYMGSDVTFGNSTFVTAGYGIAGTEGLLTSTDLAQWHLRTALFGKHLTSIAYGKGTFVAVGSDGIWQSEPVSSPGITIEPTPSTGALVIRTSGEIGCSYRMQTSSNLNAWQDFLSFTNTWPTMEFVQMPDPNITARFFRVVTP